MMTYTSVLRHFNWFYINHIMHTHILKIIGIIVLACEKGTALTCYRCDDYNTNTGSLNCSDPFHHHNPGVVIHTCPFGVNSCYKFTATYLGHAFHVRSCYPGQKTGCFNRDNVTDAHVQECYCNEDFCNGAGRFIPCGVVSFLTKFFILIILVIK